MRPLCLALFLLAPLPAILLGAAVASASTGNARAFLPNVLVCLLGGACSLGFLRLSSLGRDRFLHVMAFIAFVAIAATLASPGIDGVHRWLSVGPVRLNASAAFLPWILAGMSASRPAVRKTSTLLALGAQLLHLAQPDAAQATALAGGALALLAGNSLFGATAQMALGGLMAVLAGCTWARADPLPAVEHVERILFLAAARGPGWLGATCVTGVPVLLVFLHAARNPHPAYARAAIGFGLYWALTLAATFFGNFPVPWMGAGAGPVLGWYAFAAVLAVQDKQPREAPSHAI
ncbi:hypothetical protein [Stigmatella aurantiaca]|uniref:Conserved uncharacterized protein n=1 Tax=Stigmatella aurantiaca (strain DW4/3-1) TaxID=378806 RepID=Q09DK7_STIAD|nr:hypothetical protein [Stigmatella aurantiaca]ADO69303.1 conserved uncharacterized protein [Stigmatella aurantiaca DW4/3-1]EAU69729.1 conserved hypothetical protein [Stigmatella aurantiaca DW4/3-1]